MFNSSINWYVFSKCWLIININSILFTFSYVNIQWGTVYEHNSNRVDPCGRLSPSWYRHLSPLVLFTCVLIQTGVLGASHNFNSLFLPHQMQNRRLFKNFFSEEPIDDMTVSERTVMVTDWEWTWNRREGRQTEEGGGEEGGGRRVLMVLSPPCRWVSCGSSVPTHYCLLIYFLSPPLQTLSV